MTDKYTLLLPLHYNDGAEVPVSEINAAIEDLYRLAGGYSIEGHVKGAYRMKSGQKQEDQLLRVSIAIPPELADKLRSIVQKLCVTMRQECMWLEKSNSTIEFVGPGSDQGVDDE